MESVDTTTLNFNEQSLFLLNISLAFIMFGVSLNLSPTDFLKVFKQPKAALTGALSQFFLLPFLTYLLVLATKPIPSLALGMMLVAACPGGNISNFMTSLAKGNTALSVSLTAVSSLLAVVMTPFNLALWAGLYKPTAQILKEVNLDIWSLFQTITILLIIPLVLGMALRHKRPLVANKIHSVMRPVSILIFAVIVFMAFKANFEVFLNYIHIVIFLVLIHNALALITGYQAARMAGLSMPERRSLALETGIQNSGLGLILIFSFFDGLGGMAIVAGWWGIWHIISGLTLSFWWS